MFQKAKDQTIQVATAIGLGLLFTMSFAIPEVYIVNGVRLFTGVVLGTYCYTQYGHLAAPTFHLLTGGKYVKAGAERPSERPTVGIDASDQGGSDGSRSRAA